MKAKMTPKQQGTLAEAIDILTFGGFYEAKEVEVEAIKIDGEVRKDVLVSVIVGGKNDEGTLAEVLCRSFYSFFIGPRGGLFTYGDRGGLIRFKVYNIHDVCKVY